MKASRAVAGRSSVALILSGAACVGALALWLGLHGQGTATQAVAPPVNATKPEDTSGALRPPVGAAGESRATVPMTTSTQAPSPSQHAVARVRTSSGAWAAGAVVKVIVHEQTVVHGATDSDGWFKVSQPPQWAAVVAATLGNQTGRAVWEPPESGEPQSHVVVELARAGAISGTVVHEHDRSPIPNARVVAVPGELNPRSLARESRGAFAVEVQADELGRLKIENLRPGAEYRLHAARDGHLSGRFGVLASADRGEAEVTGAVVEVGVLPVYGALVQFVDAGSGAVLPASFSQLARISVDSAPGESFELGGLVFDELELPESVFVGGEQLGLRPFFFRALTREPPAAAFVITVQAPDFESKRVALELRRVSARMEAQPVPLASAVGPLHRVTLKVRGFPARTQVRAAGPYQIHLDVARSGIRSAFVTMDRDDQIHLMLPEGQHRMQFQAASGSAAVMLPRDTPDGWKSFEVVGETVVEMDWPTDLRGVVLDVRDEDGFPQTGVLSVAWSAGHVKDVKSVLRSGRALTGSSCMFVQNPYWIPNLAPGPYQVWLDEFLRGPGHSIEIPADGDQNGELPRVRIQRARTTAR